MQPASSAQGVGAAFELQVQVQDVTDLASVEFTLLYDPALLQVQSAELGSMLQDTPRTFGALGPHIDKAAGSVHFGAWSYGATAPGPSGAGTLALIHLLAVGPGTGRVEFSPRRPPVIINSLGFAQAPLCVSGAEVTVR